MHENLLKTPLHRVFVYGTLKRNEPNHYLLTTKENGISNFIANARTLTKYPMVIATKYNIPFLLKKPDTGNHIVGEVYDVDSAMLEELDKLEEHPTFYVRTQENVLLATENSNDSFDEASGNVTKAWIYFLPRFNSSLLNLPMFSNYSNNGSHGLKYAERRYRDPSYQHRSEVQSDN